MEGKLTIYFDDPFWVGVYERHDERGYRVARLIFGSEPLDGEVYALILRRYDEFRFGPPQENSLTETKAKNYKRTQREVRQSMQVQGIGTRAQQAIKLSMTVAKQQRQQTVRQQRAAENEERFRERQQKKKEKQRGH
jgi:hypothetical protein